MTTAPDPFAAPFGSLGMSDIGFDPARFMTALSGCLLVHGRPATAEQRRRFVREIDSMDLTTDLEWLQSEAGRRCRTCGEHTNAGALVAFWAAACPGEDHQGRQHGGNRTGTDGTR